MEINASILAVIVRVSVPILLCASGGSFCHLAGVDNIVLEGAMLIAAFAGVAGSYLMESSFFGVLFAIGGSLFITLLLGVIHLRMKGDAVVSGFALNILCLGLSTFLLRSIFNTSGTLVDPRIVGLSTFSIPFLKDIPIIGYLFTNHTFTIYFAYIFMIFSYILIYKTKFGLDVRASGENPLSASAVGVSVIKIRWFCLIIAGILCGLAGAQLSLGYLSMFSENMTAGRGFIALAAIILAGGKPFGVFLATIIFGTAEAIANQVQLLGISSHLVLMIPYLVVILVLLLNPDQLKTYFYRIKARSKFIVKGS